MKAPAIIAKIRMTTTPSGHLHQGNRMKEMLTVCCRLDVSRLACSFGSSINQAGDEACATVEEGPFMAPSSTAQ